MPVANLAREIAERFYLRETFGFENQIIVAEAVKLTELHF
jgi:hypothetical protein